MSFLSTCSLNVAFHSLPEWSHSVAWFQLPPFCKCLQIFSLGCSWLFPSPYKINTAQFLSHEYQYGLLELCFVNSMGNFFLEDVTKSISFRLLTWVCHRAKEKECLNSECWVVLSKPPPPCSSQQWKQLTDSLPLCSLLIYKTHALSLLRFMLIFPEAPWLRVTTTLCLRPCGHRASP